jgi:hypothetical protein
VWREPDWSSLDAEDIEYLVNEYRHMVGTKGHSLAHRPSQYLLMRNLFHVFCVKSEEYWVGLGAAKHYGAHDKAFADLTAGLNAVGFKTVDTSNASRIDVYRSFDRSRDRPTGYWFKRAGFVFRRCRSGFVIRNSQEFAVACLALGLALDLAQPAPQETSQPR